MSKGKLFSIQEECVSICTCRQLALKHHPDKAAGPGQREAADKLFKLVSNAYSVLSDREQRRTYDLAVLRRQMHSRVRAGI